MALVVFPPDTEDWILEKGDKSYLNGPAVGGSYCLPTKTVDVLPGPGLTCRCVGCLSLE